MANQKKDNVFKDPAGFINILIENTISTKKNRIKDIENIFKTKRTFILTNEVYIKIADIFQTLSDVEVAELFISFDKNTKEDNQQLKIILYHDILNRLNIEEDISEIFNNENFLMLKQILMKVNSTIKITSEGEEYKSNGYNPFPFLLVSAFYKFKRSASYEGVIWRTMKYFHNPFDKKILKTEEPVTELHKQLINILRRPKYNNNIPKYYNKTAPFIFKYFAFQDKANQLETETAILKSHMDLLNQQIDKLNVTIKILNEDNVRSQTELNKLNKELVEIKSDCEKELSFQETKSRDQLKMEQRMLYNKILQELTFCVSNLRAGLSRDPTSINADNIQVLLQRIQSTEDFITKIGDAL